MADSRRRELPRRPGGATAAIALATFAGIAGTTPGIAGDLTGVWMSHTGEARMRIERCGDGYCGRLVWLLDPFGDDGGPAVDEFNPDPARRSDPVLGMTILTGLELEPDDSGMHRGGRIYDPDTGRTWHCRVGLADDGRLKMRGYLAVPLLGRTVHWTPTEVPAEVAGLPGEAEPEP